MQPMVRSYDIPNTSSTMEMLHFWCVLFGHASGATPNSSIRLCIYVYRLTTCCIASTDISSLATQYTSPRDSPSSTSVTTSPFLPSYHLETSNAKTLMPSSLSCIPSEISSPLFINLLIKACLRAAISKKITSPTKSGNLCFISQLVGASLRSAG